MGSETVLDEGVNLFLRGYVVWGAFVSPAKPAGKITPVFSGFLE